MKKAILFLAIMTIGIIASAQWKTEVINDKYGNPTAQRNVYIDAEGQFTNSNDQGKCDFRLAYNSEKVYIRIMEHGSSRASFIKGKGTSVTIKVITPSGEKRGFQAFIREGSMFIRTKSRQDFLKTLTESGEYQFYFTDGGYQKYYFKIDL
jgi:DUF4097 and DUF4098 domain-containing protein YvlB